MPQTRTSKIKQSVPKWMLFCAVFSTMILIMGSHTYASLASASSPLLGIWLTQKEDRNAKIKITQCPENSGQFCGTIIWLEAPLDETGHPKTDRHNEKPELRNRPLLGLPILQGFEQNPDEPHIWEEGTIYNPEDGETYRCVIRWEQDDRGQERLFVRGYVGISLFGKTQTWVRSR